MTKPFLKRLAPAETGGVLALGRERRFRARSPILHQGDPTQHVVLLVAGWAKVSVESHSGDEVLLAIRGPDDIIGELSAIDEQPRSATVTALVPVRARIIAAQRFVQHLRDSHDVTFAMLQHVAARLRESDAERLRYVSMSSSRRVVALLLDLAEKQGVPSGGGRAIDLPLTQQEIAKAAATSREAVARTLRMLRERGLVWTSRQRVVLFEVEVLRAFVESASNDT